MTRPQEIEHKRRRGGIVLAAILAGLTLGVLAYLAVPGWQRQTATPSVEEFCRQIGSLSSFSQALAELDQSGVRNAIAALEQLDRVAPPDIEPQVLIILDTSRPMATALREAQTDESAALDKVWRPKQAEVARIRAAGTAVRDYTLTNCRIDLNTTVPPAAGSSAPTAAPSTAAPSSTSPSSTAKATEPAPTGAH